MCATPYTHPPSGEALLLVGKLLAAQFAAERVGAAIDRRLAVPGVDYSSQLMGPAVAKGEGRWAGLRGSRGKKAGGKAAPGGDRQEEAGNGGGGLVHKKSEWRPAPWVECACCFFGCAGLPAAAAPGLAVA